MTTATETRKITKATFKSFIRKNEAKLLVKVRAAFDGMTDGLEFTKVAEFIPARKLCGRDVCENNCGLAGVWIVGSRNWFEHYETETHIGIAVSNSCAYFTVAIEKA